MTKQYFARSDEGIPSDSIILDDGTLWSHAVTPGSYVKGHRFTIDKDAIDSFVRNFATSGKKLPVDYEHSTVSAEYAAARAAGEAPKAGDIVELRGVYSSADFTDQLKTSAEKLAKRAGRTLDDPATFGLWMRWKPTARALKKIKDGEYSELSIAFDWEAEHNQTGEKRGPALLSVALTNTPFVDTMLPVAASRHDGGSPAAPAEGDRAMPNTMLLSAAAALSGKPVAVQTEEEAITILTAVAPEIVRLRAFESQVGVELGEVQTDKAVARIKALKAENTEYRDRAEKAEKARIDGIVTATMKEFEDRTTPFSRDKIFAPQLRAELEKDPTLDPKKSVTVQALSELTPNGITRQQSSSDDGTSLSDDPDVKLDQVARQLLTTEKDLIEISAKDPQRAMDLAQDRAAKKIGYVSDQLKHVRGQLTK